MTGPGWDATVGVLLAAWVASYELGRLRLVAGGVDWPMWRRAAWWGAGVLAAVAALPPVASTVANALWAETLQFALLAFGTAPLAVLAAPRHPLAALVRARRADTVVTSRRRAWAALGCFIAVTVAWRVPPAVDALSSGRGWLVLEAVSVVAGTWALWSALLGSPPRLALDDPPRRIVFTVLAAWSVWVFAYAVGFSSHPFYPAYASGMTPVGAQQWVVAILWPTSAAALVPTAFVNLARWFRADQALADADSAGRRLHHAAPLSGSGASGRH